MDFEEKKIGNVYVVKILDRKIDVDNSRDLKTKLAGLFEQGHNRLLLDLCEVEYVDSSALGTLVASYKNVQDKGSISLSGLKPTVQPLIDITRLDRIFTVYTGVKSAVEKMTEA